MSEAATRAFHASCPESVVGTCDAVELFAIIDNLRAGLAVLLRVPIDETDAWARRLVESDGRTAEPFLGRSAS